MDLTERGYKQAEITAEALKDISFSAIYSSDLMRAYNTAVPNATIRGMSITKSLQLREIFAGNWEGRCKDDIIREYGELFTVQWYRHFGTFRIPGGESVKEVGQRFYFELDRIAKLHEGETVLIVSHAAAIRSFYSLISGFKPEDYAEKLSFPSNASFSIVEWHNGAFTPISYSNDAHMGTLVTKIKEN